MAPASWPTWWVHGQGLPQSLTVLLGFTILAWITPLSRGQAMTCTTLPGLYVSDSSLEGFYDLNSPSISDCCARCLANPRCGSFTWNKAKRCSLMETADPTLYRDDQTTSGVKTRGVLTTPTSLAYSQFGATSPIHLRGSALYSYSSIVLTYDRYQTGLATLVSPVQLLRDVNSRCQAASFTAAFSFQTYHSPVRSPADGFTFFLLASDIPLATLGTLNYADPDSSSSSRYQGFASSYEDALRRPGAMAIEYDTFKDTASRDPDNSHVGVNLNYHPRSVISVSTLPPKIRLYDYRRKYSWIDYDAAKSLLRVYLSYSSTRPWKPLLSYKLDLCQTLRRLNCSSCATATNAYLGFSGATQDERDQTTSIFSWSFQSTWPSNHPGTLPPSSKCTIMPGCRFNDFDLVAFSSLNSPSPSDCCAKCSAQPKCMAWNWRPDKKCDLKTAGDSIEQRDSSLAKHFCGERARVITTIPASLAFPKFSSASPMYLVGSATHVSGAIRLTYEENQGGLALYQQPVQLLRDIDTECEAASFSASFKFHIHDRSDSGWGEGFTFMVLASNLLFGELGNPGAYSENMGFLLYTNRRALPGALAVEFDTNKNSDLGSLELEAGHVGIDTRYSAVSLAAVATRRFGISLFDSRVKYAWVDYDAEDDRLYVFLGYSATKPRTPILSYGIDMCKVLRPPDCLQACASVTTGYVGFSAATTYLSQHNEILNFEFKSFWPSAERDTGGLRLGVVPVERAPQKLNQHFRYASMGYLAQTGAARRPPSWLVAIRWNWTEDAVAPIRDQKDCGACYAFATASAIESAFFLTHYTKTRTVPDIAEQQLVDCLGAGRCQGGWPADALDHAARYPIVSESAYPYKGTNSTCKIPTNPAVKYQLASFEAVSFLGWLGLLLAVQQTPVVVNIEGSKASFIGYTGGIYDDGNCYSRGVDHSVVIVGYDLLSSPPYWIIRNSWGTKWGERGYMRMAIWPGDGICGINTMPGYVPVFKAKDACNTNSYPKQTGLFNVDAAPGRLNPCGGGKCTNLAGGKNKCACPQNFMAAANSDGSQTCVPVSPCTFLQDNPCRIGTCLDSESKPGTYSCICPIGYEEGNVAADGSTTCVPAALVGGLQFYTVLADFSVTCARIYEVYGISKATFLAQNKGLPSCSKPLPTGTRVNVTNNLLKGCALPYAVNVGDTCTSIAKLFNIAALSGKASPNPELSCSSLQPGQQVCIKRRSASDKSSPDVPLCTAPYTVSGSETCSSLIKSKFGGNAGTFFTLNPGLYCNNFNRFNVANITLGQQVCTAATNMEAIHRGCRGRLVSVQAGDTCLSLSRKYFCGRRRVFRQYNGNWNCDNRKLFTSKRSNSRLRLCAPKVCY